MFLSNTGTEVFTGGMTENPMLLLLFCQPVMSNSLQPQGLEHTRPPCLSPSPEVCPSSHPLHWWCHPAISSSDALFFCPQCFSFCPQSFPASGSFLMSWLFTSGDKNTGASASASVWALTHAKMLLWLLLGPVAICRSSNHLQSVCAHQSDTDSVGAVLCSLPRYRLSSLSLHESQHSAKSGLMEHLVTCTSLHTLPCVYFQTHHNQ